jgi:hypothetical protein
VAPDATPLWAAVGRPASRGRALLLAFRGVPDAGSRWGARHRLGSFRHKSPHLPSVGFVIYNHHNMGLQPHPRKPFRGNQCACQCRYPTGCFDTALIGSGGNQYDSGLHRWPWGGGSADSHPDPRSTWLPAFAFALNSQIQDSQT